MSALTRPAVVLAMTLALAAAGTPRSAGLDEIPHRSGAGVRAVADGARAKTPREATTVLTGATAEELALTASATLFDHAPLVLLAAAGEPDAQGAAAPFAARLGAPLLLTPAMASTDDALTRELDRLGVRSLLTFGAAPRQWSVASGGDWEVVTAPAAATEIVGVPAAAQGAGDDGPLVGSQDGPAPLVGEEKATPVSRLGQRELLATEPAGAVLVLASSDEANLAATATARGSGASVHVLAVPDPRSDSGVIADLANKPARPVVALGADFGSPEQLRLRIDTAATGLELPGGGQLLFPGRRMVALYGTPGSAALGVLGEQPLEATLARAKRVAADYAPLSDVPVVPALEIIATVASSDPGGDGNYSSEGSVERLQPWVEQAGAAGIYVVLDLQPGRTDFLTQAQRYEELVALPNVGVALDPEWRLRAGQRHMAQTGSVGIGEVNEVVTWLADLTRERKLPQKLLIVHQFRLSMIAGRESLDTSREELAIVIHVDGNGSPPLKQRTWRTLTASPPAGSWLGWKNFYDEDTPMLTPTETMAVRPTPFFISYQ